MPDARRAKNALVSLRDSVASTLAARQLTPPEHDASLRLAGDLHDVYLLALWLRDASLAVARAADPEVSWTELQDATHIQDSTLHSRLITWRAVEAMQ
jgi:hypothetical protein